MGGLTVAFFLALTSQNYLPIQQKYAAPQKSASQDRVCRAFAGRQGLCTSKI